MRLAGAARNYGRNLVADVRKAGPLDADIGRATKTLTSALEAVMAALNGHQDGTYTRSAALHHGGSRP